MALAPLATIADLTARGMVVDATEETTVNTYFDVASAVVRHAAQSPISETTSTIEIEGVSEQRLFLPGLPIRSVSTVTIDDDPVTDWKLVSDALWRRRGWLSHYVPSPYAAQLEDPSIVSVTYTHGLQTVPSDIVDLVCRMVARTLIAFRAGDPAARPVANERIGDYAVTYTDAETGTLSLSEDQRCALAKRFGRGVGVVRTR